MFNPNAIGVGAHADGVAVKHLTLGRAKYKKADAETEDPIEHVELVHDTYSQKRIVSALTGRSILAIPDTDISTGLALSLPQSVVRLIGMGLINPIEFAAAGVQKLQSVVDDIHDELNSALDFELPVIRKSLNDILGDPLEGLQFDVFGGFATTLNNLATAPDLETLEHRVETQAGFSDPQFEITFVNGVLDLAFDFNIMKSSGLTINFGASSFGLTGSIVVGGSVKLDADFHLTLDMGGYLASGNTGNGADFLSITLNKFEIGAALSATDINVGVNVDGFGGVSVANGNASIGAVLGIAFDDADHSLSVAELLTANTFSSVVDFAPSIPLDINLPIVTSGGTHLKTIEFHDDLLGAKPVLPTITLDEDYIVNNNETLTYAGNIIFAPTARILGDGVGGADSLTINAGGAVTFQAPVGGSGLLNLTVNSGVDIVVAANTAITLPGGHVQFVVDSEANGEIELGAGAKIITRVTAGSNPVTDASTGNSGHIDFSANEIELKAGAQLLAHVLSSDTESPGHILFQAINNVANTASLIGLAFSDRLAKVTLTGATLQAGDIVINAQAENIEQEGTLPSFLDSFTGPIESFLEKIPGLNLDSLVGISASVVSRGATATIDINNSTITSSGRVTIGSTSRAESPVEALSFKNGSARGFTVGYGAADSTAETNIRGTTTITAVGNVSIGSDATAKANVVARNSANIDENNEETQTSALVIAISSTDLESHTNLEAATVISSSLGNVSVDAKGNVTNFPDATTGLDKDGKAGITVALGFDDSHVEAIADGTIIAKGRDDRLTFNPSVANTLDTTANTIRIPNHGLKTGDVITYESNGGAVVRGLTDGDQYVVNVVDADTFQLSRGGHIDLRPSSVNATATHSISLQDVLTFSPLAGGIVDLASDRITIPNHGLENGQRVTYQASDDSGSIGGLISGEDYLIDSQSTDSFRLKLARTGVLVNLTAQPLDDAPLTADHAFLIERPKKTFNPQTGINTTRDTITLTNHGFETGDAVTYRTDPTQTRTQGTIDIADPAISGLQNGETYFVVVVDADTIRLTMSEKEAQDAEVVDLSSIQFPAPGANQTISLGSANGIDVTAKLTARNFARGTTKTNVEPGMLDKVLNTEVGITEGANALVDKLSEKLDLSNFSKDKEPVKPKTKSKGGKFSGAASIVVNEFDHVAHAIVGANADLKSQADIRVLGNIEQKVVTIAEGEAARKKGQGGTAVAGAAAVGLFDNEAKAIVSAGAHLNAQQTIDVKSEIEWPIPRVFSDPSILLSDPQGAIMELTDEGPKLALGTNLTLATSSASGGGSAVIGGAVTVTDFTNHSEAVIRDGAFINQDAAFQTITQEVNVAAETVMTSIDVAGGFASAQGPGLLDSLKFWKKSSKESSQSSKGGVGGGVNLTFYDNTTQAHIETGARVRTGSSGGLNVTANEDLKHLGIAASSADAAAFGLSGSVTILDQASVTQAWLASGVIVTGGPVLVDATDSSSHISITGSYLSGNGKGIGASVSITDINRNTAAWIGSADGQAAGAAGTSITSSGTVTVAATSTGALYGFAIAAAKISDPMKSSGGGGSDDEGSEINGDELDTSTDVSEASTASNSKSSTSGDQGQQGKYGLALTGAVSLNTLTDTTLAFINDTGSITATGQQVEIIARNSTTAVAASGSAALATTSRGGATLAGAWSQTGFLGTTRAYVSAVTLAAAQLDVNAKRDGELIAIAAGGSGATRKSGRAIAGSVTISRITDTTTASILNNAHITTTGSVFVEANNDANIIAVAGAFAFGSQTGIGAGVSVNRLTLTTSATISGATITYVGQLGVTSLNDGDIVSIAGAAAVSTEGNAATGTAAVNLLTSHVTSSISGSSNVTGTGPATGGISVTARDESSVITGSGAASISKGSGLGAAVSYTSLTSNVRAFAENSTLTTTGIATFAAAATSGINSVAVGVAGSKNAALAGSVTINFIDSNADAHVSNGARLTARSVTISSSDGAGGEFDPQRAVSGNYIDFGRAHGLKTGDQLNYNAGGGDAIGGLSDGKAYYIIADASNPNRIRLANSASDATAGRAITLSPSSATGSRHSLAQTGIFALAGGIAVSTGSATAGAAVAFNDTRNNFTAYIDGATTTVTAGVGDVDVQATSTADILSFAIGVGAGAGSFSLGGSYTYNDIQNTIDAHISGQATVTANQSVDLTAHDRSTMTVIAGGVAASKGAAIGAAVATNFVRNTVTTTIDRATVTATNANVTLDAQAETGIFSITVGAGGAASFALLGSFSVNDLANTTRAAITGGAGTTNVTARGTVQVQAFDDVNVTSIGGAISGAGSAAVGLANSTVLTNNTTEASIGRNATVTGRGFGAGVNTFDGSVNFNGDPQTTAMTGVIVSAVSFEDVLTIAIGGSVAGSAGIAGSATVSKLIETTRAFIDRDTTINANHTSDSTSQDVRVIASDATDLQGFAGALGGGGAAGIGAAADVGLITKTTTAFIDLGANVKANRDVRVAANSREDVLSVSGAIGAGGSAGLAGSADVYVVTLTTRAFIGDDPTTAGADTPEGVLASGSVAVTANDVSDFNLIAGTVSAGGAAAIGGAAGVAVFNKTTEAFLGDNANVNALGQRSGLTVETGSFAIGSAPLAASNQEVSVQGYNAGSSEASDDSLTSRRTATPNLQSGVSGVVVTAINRDSLKTSGVSGGGAGAAAIQLAASVTLMTATTRAFVGNNVDVNQTQGSTTNAGAGGSQSVFIAAGSDVSHLGIGGSVAGAGAAGIAPGIEATLVTNTTEASIGTSSKVTAKGDVSVVATASEDILTVAAGAALGGAAGIGGAGSGISIDNTTRAFIGNSATVDAGGSVLVRATDFTDTDLIAGSAGLGGAAGIGASVGVTLIKKRTEAFIDQNAVVDAKGNSTATISVIDGRQNGNGTPLTESIRGVAVQAYSTENVFTVAGTGAIGGAVGLAGAVAVAMLDSDTTAEIRNNARVNQATSNNLANSQQTVSVGASNRVTIESVGAAAALGGAAGIGGGVDVQIVRNDTTARIGNNARVAARQDVDVHAVAERAVSSLAISAAAGLVGFGGGVSVLSFGGNVGSNYTNDSTQDVLKDRDNGASSGGFAEERTGTGGINTLLSQYNGSDQPGSDNTQLVGEATTSARGSLNSRGRAIDPTDEIGANVTPSGTSALIGDGAIISAGRHVDVVANEQIDVSISAGSGSAGLAGIGAAVAIVNLSEHVTARIGASANVSAGTLDTTGDVNVTAGYRGTTNGAAYSGAAGVVGLGAAVMLVNDHSAATASIGNNADVTNADAVNVLAFNTTTLTSFAGGASVGLIGGGASVTRVTGDGSAAATIGDGVEIGRVTGRRVGSVFVNADATFNGTATTLAIAAGFVGVGVNSSNIALTPSTTASIGVSTFITTTGNIEVLATGNTNGTARTSGVAAGAIAVALSYSDVNLSPTITASVGNSTQLTAGADLLIRAFHARDNAGGSRAVASGNGSVGGLIAVGDNSMSTRMAPTVTTTVGDFARLTAGRDLRVEAESNGQAQTDATNKQGGLVSAAFATATATVFHTAQTTLGTDSIVTAGGNAFVQSFVDGTGDSSVDGFGISGIDFSRGPATTNVNFVSTATVGDRTRITASGLLTVQARSGSAAYSTATLDAGGLGADTFPQAQSLIGGGSIGNDPSGDQPTSAARMETDIGANARLTGAFVIVKSQADWMTAEADASASAIAAGADVDADARAGTHSLARVRVRGGAVLDGSESVTLATNHYDPVSDADAYTFFAGLGGDSDPTTLAYQKIANELIVDSGSSVATPDLLVDSKIVRPVQIAHSDGDSYAIDFGTNDPNYFLSFTRNVNYNATTTIRSRSPELRVADDGRVTRAVGVDLLETDDEIIVARTFASGSAKFDMPNPLEGFPLFSTLGLAGSTLTGTATFTFERRAPAVTLDNASAKDLRILSLAVENDVSPAIDVDVAAIVQANFTTATTVGSATDVPVTIFSPRSDVILGGSATVTTTTQQVVFVGIFPTIQTVTTQQSFVGTEINNPIGSVDIQAANIFADHDHPTRIAAPAVGLFVSNAVGSPSDPILTAADSVSGSTGTGGYFVTDSDALTAGNIIVGGDVRLFANGALTVTDDIYGANVTLTATDAASSGQNVVLDSGVLVAAIGSGNDVTINAGDNLTVSSDATITAADDVRLNSDAGNADTGTGTTVRIDGALFGDVSITGGSDTDTLIVTSLAGDATENVWTVTGTNAGNINGVFAFTSFENLTGGAFADTFRIADGVTESQRVSGKVDGAGGRDTLDYSLFGVGRSATVDRQMSTASGTGGFLNIEQFVGGASAFDTLIGKNAATMWTVTTDSAGFVNGTETNPEFTFSDVENLTGGTSNDTFVLRVGAALGGKITGSRETTPSDSDRIDVSAYGTSVRFDVSGSNAGTLTESRTLATFASVENLRGGSGDDSFVFAATAGISGLIEGNGGANDTLDYAAWTETVTVNLATGSNMTGTQTSVEHVIGGTGNDVLIGDANANRLFGNAGNDSLTGGGGADILVGDRFTPTFTSGVLTTLQAEAGEGRDTLVGSSSGEIFMGGGNGDVINAGDGANLIFGDYGTLVFSGTTVTSAISNTGTNIGGDDTITTGLGADSVVAGDGFDTLTDGGGRNLVIGDRGKFVFVTGVIVQAESFDSGMPKADSLTLGSGADSVLGGGGSDVILAGLGNDLVLGDGGSLQFTSGTLDSFELFTLTSDGNDSIDGNSGSDTISAGDGNNTITGGDGTDDLFAGAGRDVIDGGDQDDFIAAGLGNDSIAGGSGNDLLIGGNFASRATFVVDVTTSYQGDIDDGLDSIFGNDGNDSVFGGSNADSLDGGNGADFVDAGAGDDLEVRGGASTDTVRGGVGNDVLHGDDGIDVLFGDGGDDKLFGDTGSGNSQAGQSLFGGDGNDELFASATASTTVGDQLFGDAGNDTLRGNIAGEMLVGGLGSDFLVGDGVTGTTYTTNTSASTAGGNDTIFGDSGEDILFGGGGNDLIWGGSNSDNISGEAGSNTVFGGEGIDIFTLWTGASAGDDKLDGHGGNATLGDVVDDHATDILKIVGTNSDDVILLSQRISGTNAGKVRLDYKAGLATTVIRNLDFLNAAGVPLVEQFQISGLAGHDVLGFATGDATLPVGVTNPLATSNTGPLDLSPLNARGRDWVSKLLGDSGNDLLLGSGGRDSMDGGLGSDVLYGFAGDDRLWGDQGNGATTDVDVIFGGAGNDDAIGGVGTNFLYAWSFAPDARLVPTPGASFSAGNVNALIDGGAPAEFGVFVNRTTGQLQASDGDANNDGILDGTTSDVPYSQEVTGLNRTLGGERNDYLFGGTTVDFLFGNGGQDVLFRADGSTMNSLDDGLGGDDWKEYAREQDEVWYIGGTNADDEINVDFVTEPGVLADHHLVTRLTNNNGNFSFAAQIKLDVNATDGNGDPIWNPLEPLNLNELQALIDNGDVAGASAQLANLQKVGPSLVTSLLPPEGEYLVILIDALDGNDTIEVGPTVQKTVWIDAGDGDDRVEIRGGNSILVDQAENSAASGKTTRNDAFAAAYPLSVPADGVQFDGLTIDNPNDVDWFTFTLPAHGATANLTMTTASPADTVTVEVFTVLSFATNANPSPVLTATATQTTTLNLNSLTAGTSYAVRVKTNLTPTIYGLAFDFGAAAADVEVVSLSSVVDLVRQDVILGGDGDDILLGGSGEDWIFGQAGNDVLSGGRDRQASDLLFGGSGNDTFQVIPDALPLRANQPNTVFDPATQTQVTTASDLFSGGDGEDRVLFLGGDTDRRGFDVPDFVALNYNTTLFRYELSSLIWDIGTQAFRTTTDANGQAVYQQEFAYYQTRDVEQTQIDTRAGNDVVHADDGFQFLPVAGLLTHRYSFNETNSTTFRDSVGGLDAVLVDQSASGTTGGGGGFDLTGRQVRLFGGAKSTSDYIELPDSLLNGLTDVTFDLWATRQSVQDFARIFDFGNGIDDYLIASWSRDLVGTQNRVEWRDTSAGSLGSDTLNTADDTFSEFTNGTEFHLTFVVDEGAGTGGKTLVSWYQNGVAKGSFDTDAKISTLTQNNNWLGRGKLGVKTADASYNEFRVYRTALTASEIAQSNALGPEQLPPVGGFAEYGIARGDFEQGAVEAAIQINGGDGDDLLFGGALADTISGGGGDDYLVGGLGNDRLNGDGGADDIFGLLPDSSTVRSGQPVAPPLPANFPANTLPERFEYDLAAPFLNFDLNQRSGTHLGDPTTYNLADDAFALEGAEPQAQLADLIEVGDFNADGQSDFLVRGADRSYLLFGPVELDNLASIDSQADFIFEHSAIGVPGDRFDDVNGDGLADLVFVAGGDTTTVRIVMGGADAGFSLYQQVEGFRYAIPLPVGWPRLWDQDFVSVLLDRSSQVNYLTLSELQLSPTGVSASLLNYDTDGLADLLVTANTTDGTLIKTTTSLDVSDFNADANTFSSSNGPFYVAGENVFAINDARTTVTRASGASRQNVTGLAANSDIAAAVVANDTLWIIANVSFGAYSFYTVDPSTLVATQRTTRGFGFSQAFTLNDGTRDNIYLPTSGGSRDLLELNTSTFAFRSLVDTFTQALFGQPQKFAENAVAYGTSGNLNWFYLDPSRSANPVFIPFGSFTGGSTGSNPAAVNGTFARLAVVGDYTSHGPK